MSSILLACVLFLSSKHQQSRYATNKIVAGAGHLVQHTLQDQEEIAQPLPVKNRGGIEEGAAPGGKGKLRAELRKVACEGVSEELSGAVSELEDAREAADAEQHVPSVLGDVFGGIEGRTV